MNKVMSILVAILFVLSGLMMASCKSEEERLLPPVDHLIPQGYYTEPSEAKDKLVVGRPVVDKTALRVSSFDFEIEVTNSFSQVLEYAELAYTVYDQDGQLIGGEDIVSYGTKIWDLEPGESTLLHSGTGIVGVGLVILISRFEYTLQNIMWSGESTSLPEQEEEEEQAEEGAVYTVSNYPENPETAEEVVVALYFLVNEGNYWEAAKLVEIIEDDVNSGRATKAQAEDWVANVMGEFLGFGDLESIRIERIQLWDERAWVSITLYFTDVDELYTIPSTVKEDGKWKWELSNF